MERFESEAVILQASREDRCEGPCSMLLPSLFRTECGCCHDQDGLRAEAARAVVFFTEQCPVGFLLAGGRDVSSAQLGSRCSQPVALGGAPPPAPSQDIISFLEQAIWEVNDCTKPQVCATSRLSKPAQRHRRCGISFVLAITIPDDRPSC